MHSSWKKLPILSALAGALVIGMAACGASEPTLPSGASLEVGGVEVSSRVPSGAVEFSFTTHNSGSESVRFPAGRFSAYQVVVVDEAGEIVWQRLAGAYAAGPATPFEIPSGATEPWSATWPLVDNEGDRVAPGTYELFGLVGTDLNEPFVTTQRVSVEVQ